MMNQPNFDNVIQSDIFIQQGTTGDWKKMFTPERDIEERDLARTYISGKKQRIIGKNVYARDRSEI